MRDRLGDAEMLNLGVRKHLVDAVNGSTGNARCVEQVDERLAGVILGVGLDGAIEGIRWVERDWPSA